MRFTKISYAPKDERVHLEYFAPREGGRPDTHTADIHHPPHPDFTKALAGLLPLVFSFCDLTGLEYTGTEVRGLSLKWDDDTMGVVITASRRVSRSTKPFNINTPFMKADDGEDSLSDLETALIGRVIDEAEAYLAGTKRGQLPQAELALPT